jgi:hypothetical protein
MFCVPAGFEAARMMDGILSKLYREGDRICINARKDPPDTHLYICKKQVSKPLKWGMGDIPYYAEQGGLPVLYGANGTLRILVANMTKLLQYIMGGMIKLDTEKIGRYLEADIAAHIKRKLMESVQKNGLVAAASRPDLIAAAIKPELAIILDRLGIWPEAFTVDSVEVLAPGTPQAGREQG